MADNSDAVTITVNEAIRLASKAHRLLRQAEEAMAVAAQLAGPYGEHVDRDTLRQLVGAARAADVPGRGEFSRLPHRTLLVPGLTTGSKRRRSSEIWPQPSHAVYMLLDDQDCLLYIGKTTRLAYRMSAHASKPWAVAHWWVCEDDAHASRLEADLIFQHQPPLNIAGRAARMARTA